MLHRDTGANTMERAARHLRGGDRLREQPVRQQPDGLAVHPRVLCHRSIQNHAERSLPASQCASNGINMLPSMRQRVPVPCCACSACLLLGEPDGLHPQLLVFVL